MGDKAVRMISGVVETVQVWRTHCLSRAVTLLGRWAEETWVDDTRKEECKGEGKVDEVQENHV